MRFAHHLHSADFESRAVCAPCGGLGLAFKRWTLLALAALAWSVVLAPALRAQSHWAQVSFQNTSNSSTVSRVTEAKIFAAVGRDQRVYQTVGHDGGFRMTNPRNGFAVNFRPAGVEFEVGTERWGMTLEAYGYGDKLPAVPAASPDADANRVEYARGELTEWYENGPLGLEQGFTVQRRPRNSRGRALTLELSFTEGLTASVDSDGRGLTFHKNGSAVLRYGGLAAADARGRELRAHMEVADNRLRLRIDDAKAQYPVTVDPVVQSATLTASDGVASDFFGGALSISRDGNTIVVGANQFGRNGPGAAYVFVRPATGWSTTSSFAAKLQASNGLAGDQFGNSVAISNDGSTVAVGADGAGAVYMFVRPSGGWAGSSPLQETNEILGSPAGFGFAVSLSGDGNTLAVGASNAQNEAEVFVTTNGWTSFTSAQLTASDGSTGNFLGFSVQISSDGNAIVAGASGATIGSNSFQGAAYVFVKSASGWVTATETAKLTASDGAYGDELGYGVAISGDGSTIVAGAPFAQIGATPNAGAAYVFVMPAGGWASSTEVAKLTESDVSTQKGFFAGTVAISSDGGTALVFKGWGGLGNPPAAVYVYSKPGNGWMSSSETTQMTADFGATDRVSGLSLIARISPVVYRPPFLTIVAGAPALPNGSDQGAAYVFTGFATSSVPVFSLGDVNIVIYSGATSPPQPVTLTNTGTAPLGVAAVAATGSFSTTQNCVAASPLAPSASCTEYVTFAAGAVGTFNGTLTFTDDAGNVDGSTQQVALSATVTRGSTTTTLTSSSNPALVGQSVTFSYSVLPPSGDTLTPSGTVTVNASSGESCVGTAPSGSCALTLTTAGTRTITASYNGDSNFTASTSTALVQRVLYEPAGTVCDGAPGHQILPPVNADGSSVFKQGRNIPAKFRVCDINGVSIGSAGVVTSFNLTQIITGTAMTNVEDIVDTNNPDTMFRWDPSNMEWIFNITTQNLLAGSTYVYTIGLNDGTSIVFQYGLR